MYSYIYMSADQSRRSFRKPSPELQRVIGRATTQVQSTHQAEVTGAHVLVAMIDEHDSRAAGLLRQYGITRYDATRYICHKIAKQASREPAVAPAAGPPAALDQPPGLLAKVQLLNDDYTPM